ncbi:hypothetical protein [uncultured Corynebacterium sp.]|uniref:hypothetical protein n=1 Tax=uncultured Corynebacterium sp. TaxID=159447 RepID=UPI0025EB012F|nr:hypothetical protein [uncultured Corynebacterium sp.]
MTFEIVYTTAQDAAVHALRETWRDDRNVSDPDVIGSLGNLATGIIGETLDKFGAEGLVSGISVADGAVTNAAWVRALEDAVDRVAGEGRHVRADIARVVDRSVVMLAEESLESR